MDPVTVPAVMSAGMSALAGTVVFLFLRLEKVRQEQRADAQASLAALQAEHAKRLDDKDRSTAALLAQNDRLHSSLERMSDLVETTIGRKTPQ